MTLPPPRRSHPDFNLSLSPLQATTKRDGPERTKNNIVGVGVFVVECKLDFIFRHFENIILSNVVVVVLSLDALKKNYKKKFISELGGG